MTRLNILIASILFVAFILSCSDEPRDVVIDPELQPYVDSFLSEASKRGIDIDLQEDGLDIFFEEDISTADYAGICRYRLGANEIGIDREVWDRSSEDRKQWLVFHELGHCVLDRSHRNDKFDNGMWKSLMRGDPLSDRERIIPLCYLWDRKEYFIDELFDENTVAPEWITRTFEYGDAPERIREVFSVEPDTETLNRLLPEKLTDFEIEYTVYIRGGAEFNSILYGGEGNLAFNYVYLDYANGDILIGNDILSCIRFPFDSQYENKVTIRQKDGTTAVFVNEEFIHSFPAYEIPVERIRKAGNSNAVLAELKIWSLS